MSKLPNADEPANPANVFGTRHHGLTKREHFAGLTKREYFAGLAMQGLLQVGEGDAAPGYAVYLADALLIALEES